MIRDTNLIISELDKVMLSINIQCVYMHLAEREDGWECGSHIHDTLEIGYIFKGCGSYNVGGINYSANPGDVFVIPPNVQHFEIKDPLNPFEIMFIMVKHHGKNAMLLDELVQKLQGRVNTEQHAKIRSIFNDVYNELILKNPGYLSLIDARLKQLYIILFREVIYKEDNRSSKRGFMTPKAEQRKKQVISEVIKYIENHLEHKISINVLSKMFFYHPKYLSNVFKSYTGKSLNDFIAETRIEKAKELLSHTNISVENIARKVGFSNSEYFYKCFKTITGTTPSSFRAFCWRAPRHPLDE